jgi:thiosulfate/3-mercaptopyruvate sulfurtransferase
MIMVIRTASPRTKRHVTLGGNVNKRVLSLLLVLALAIGTIAGLAGCSQPAAPSTPAATTPAATVGGMTAEEMAAAEAARKLAWISVADLAADTTKYVILDNRDPKAYAAGHIEGAISAPWQTFASVTKGKPGDKDWGTLLPAADIAAALGKLGVDSAKPIVVYADPTGWGEDGRVMWTLQSIGIENVQMLDGGFPAWSAAGNKASKAVPKPAATTVTPAADNLGAINVTTVEVKAAIDASTAVILDVRTAKEYGGATDFGETRGGHLPKSINIPFQENFKEDGTLKSNDDLMKLYMDAGIPMDATVYAYCTKGIRSAYTYEVLKMLGFKNPRNWDASFYTWAGDSTLPVEK